MKTFKILLLLIFLLSFHTITDAQLPDTIKIGFLIADKQYPAAIHGAEMAIEKANAKVGMNGKPFKLVVRSMEGPWGTGSREATNLIFDDKVAAIAGSHDGRNAHIVEQVCTKSRVVFVSAWPGDPTLSQAFVPWFFNCVPNNTQQAELLINELYGNKKYKSIAVVSDAGYDSELALKTFMKKAQLENKPLPHQLKYVDSKDLKNLISQIGEKKTECVILFTAPAYSVKIIRALKESNIKLPLYGALSLLDENESPDKSLKSYENVILISPGYLFTPEGSAFIKEFKERKGYAPGAVSSYAYDAVSLLVGAIKDAGLEYDMIQKSIMGVKHSGVTGMVAFDKQGNRQGPFGLMVVKNGLPAMIK